MKRLSTDTMTSIIEDTGQVIEYNEDQASDKQLKHFNKAMKGDDTAPAYMVKFVTKYNPKSAGNMHDLKAEKITGKTFVITSAQNNTNVHEKFLESIKQFCKFNDAELLIGKFVYNKNGFQNGQTEDEDIYYDTPLANYLIDDLTQLADDLFFTANLNILPTAKMPLNGFESLQGNASIIAPTSKIALQSVATMKNDVVKMMYGTGTVTLKNYIQKKAGQVAESAHSYGACIVTIDDDGIWFVRHIETDHTGIFQDLTTVYSPDTVTPNINIAGVTFGDFHSEKMDYPELAICKKIVQDMKPPHAFVHDLFDMSTRNHHNKQSGHFLHKMHEMGFSVRNDLEVTARVLNYFSDLDVQLNIVESNHDQALQKWIDDPVYNYKTDPQNAEIFLELQLAMYQNVLNNDFILLEHALKNTKDLEMDHSMLNFLMVDESFKVAGIECAVHGHIGMNGSRGNPRQFQKLNKPMNTGHTHQCSIYGNVYTSGVTGSLDMGYNQGAGSWTHSHTLIYSNGFRTIITTKNGRYC